MAIPLKRITIIIGKDFERNSERGEREKVRKVERRRIVDVERELEEILAGLESTRGITREMLEEVYETYYMRDDDEFEVCDALEDVWKPYDGASWWNAFGEVMNAYACMSLLEHGYDRMYEEYFDEIMSGTFWQCWTFDAVDVACSCVVESDSYEEPDEASSAA